LRAACAPSSAVRSCWSRPVPLPAPSTPARVQPGPQRGQHALAGAGSPPAGTQLAPGGAAPPPQRARQPCPPWSSSAPWLPWPSPRPDSARTAPPRGSRGPIGVVRKRRRPRPPTPPRRSAPPPDLHVLHAARRPAPPAPSSPS
jgi:hypothetical protein